MSSFEVRCNNLMFLELRTDDLTTNCEILEFLRKDGWTFGGGKPIWSPKLLATTYGSIYLYRDKTIRIGYRHSPSSHKEFKNPKLLCIEVKPSSTPRKYEMTITKL